MNRIAGLLGWDGMAAVLGLTESACRKKGDPDCPGSLTYEEALALDTAYDAAGGEGFPLHDAYALRLSLSIEKRAACERDLVRAVGKVAKETGEAVDALLAASDSRADRFTRETAAREAEEAIQALTGAVRKIGGGPVGLQQQEAVP
ncbi:MAG: phage regulatory CII family protein [Pseudomonadota bacterium]